VGASDILTSVSLVKNESDIVKTSCCHPPFGSPACIDCPLTAPSFTPSRNVASPFDEHCLVELIMALVDDYADAFRAAARSDGGVGYADGLIAKVKKDALRTALRRALVPT